MQVKIKSDWGARRFDPAGDKLHTYFLKQVKEAQFFSPPIEKYELHYTIIQQLPFRAREILSTVDFSDFEKISQSLSQLDNAFEDKQSNTKKTCMRIRT